MPRREMSGASLSAAGAPPSGSVVAPRRPARRKMDGAQATTAAVPSVGPDEVPVTLRVNGQVHRVFVDPRTTLLDALRERLALTGTKKGCDRGACGACTVLVDGRRINSCLTLACMHEGQEITTIEGLARGRQAAPDAGRVHRARRLPVRLLHPGPDLSAVALLEEGHTGSDAEIREWMSGNICRCGAYNRHRGRHPGRAAKRGERGQSDVAAARTWRKEPLMQPYVCPRRRAAPPRSPRSPPSAGRSSSPAAPRSST